jgi:WD40 repeat protein/serine/threonine protein kinase
MTPERWQQVKDIFDGAVEFSPVSRMAYIRERCGNDEELRKEVESLLASDTQTGALLNNPLLDTGTGVTAHSDEGAASSVRDDSFGPYVPTRVLGEGGMGTVYLARQQQPIRREVALKVVKLGMDSRQVLERFEIERQALALMDHPNIARVLDAGTSEGGRPYFVMEYVEGVPITQYCDAKAISTRERLQLFIPVCKALQHAHKKGIIHRDVKPSNVLVTEVDGKPVPKVIDFGVARATEHRSAERDAFTLSGQLIGTPEYMSPEQASLNIQDIDTGTDVYSLGVILYELLVGMLPLDIKSLRKLALGEVLRAIRETPVPKLTARITEMGAVAEELALRRSTNPGQLKRELAGDLESIVMKAIDKDRHCRYASASEFAADIERYLKDEPVLASPPERGYRIRRFILRHRLYLVAAASVLFCLLLGLAASTAMYFKAQFARREAERKGDIARQQSYIANIVAADLHIRSNEVAEARRRLLSCPKELRQWEWRHLFLKTDCSRATLYTVGDSNPQPSLAFSADGSRIYSSTQHTLHAWDATTYLPIARWSGFGSILAVAPFAEKILAKVYTTGVMETDHTLHIFDPFSHRLIATFKGHHEDITAAAFSPDGARVITGDSLGVLFLWDAASGRMLLNLTPGAKGVTAIAFSQDGKRIVVAFGDNTVRLLDAVTGVIVATRGFLGVGRNIAVAFSPDNKRLAISSDKSMLVLESGSGRLQLEVTDFDWPIVSLAFNREGTRMLVGTMDGVVQIRDGDFGKPVEKLLVPGAAVVRAIAFHPDGHLLTADQTKILVWDPSSLAGVKTFHDPGRWLTSIAFAPNGRFLASESDDTIRLWDPTSGKLLSVLKPGEGSVELGNRGIVFSSDSTYLASRSGLCTIAIWNIISGAKIKAFEGCEKKASGAKVTSIAFSPNGMYLASGSSDGIIRLWGVATGRLLLEIVVSDPVNAVDFSPDGGRIAIGTGDPFGHKPTHAPPVRVWDVGSGKLVVSTQLPPGESAGPSGKFERARGVVYSYDGKRLASVQDMRDGPTIWDANSGRLLIQLKRPLMHFGLGDYATFHPVIAFQSEGRRIFGAYGDLIQVWDSDSGEPLLLLHSDRKQIMSIALSADGQRLLSGAIDGTVNIWDTRSAYDLEAEGLVQSLFNKLHFAKDVTETLRTDPSLNESTRKNALLLAQQKGDHDHLGHIRTAWKSARAPGMPRTVYELGLRHAQVACDLAPWDWEAFNARGAVQYRLGANRDALSSLLHAAEIRVRPSITNLALEALTYHKLGESGKALSALLEAKRRLENLDAKGLSLKAAAKQHLQNLLENRDTMMESEPAALVQEAISAIESTRR